ncbi:nucleotidyltransferase [Plakobranchus ocellatus]|uniref:Nucleotidyltransferase n=1 Tax=Plakobranchus ocellatus TaxID=259542 RepID=A0AAV4CHU5_9GAST|nr:nucleotidyltransferase [Plakobranchus ocellatus]
MWAYRRRNKPPHPLEMLSAAHEKGRVILVFSINGQHGWHGFCESLFKCEISKHSKASDLTQTMPNNFFNTSNLEYPDKNEIGESLEYPNSSAEGSSLWCHFPVSWLVHFQDIHTFSCLDFKYTDHLDLSDGSPLNKARNWQQLPPTVGDQLCSLIEEHFTHLKVLEEEKKLKLSEKPESFFKSEQRISLCQEKDTIWEAVIAKVTEELGKVHLVCPFGSQRYNCDTESSDLDIFILYQAKTVDMLGLDPPRQTIKNSHHEEVDYSVLELQRYCELLMKGDAKCVETLFLSDSPVIVRGSPEWQRLYQHRNLLLTEQCLDKYLKEIKGTTGLKNFQRWRDSNPDTEELTPKLAKLGYIVLRLLQNARDMVMSSNIVVFREEASVERKELMAVRKGDLSYSAFMAVVNRYLAEIEKNKGNIGQATETAKSRVQDWLIECRLEDLRHNPAPSSTTS